VMYQAVVNLIYAFYYNKPYKVTMFFITLLHCDNLHLVYPKELGQIPLSEMLGRNMGMIYSLWKMYYG
jgi:hypothetical protein